LSVENLLKPDIYATWKAMEKLYNLGRARAIGVSNFSCKRLEDFAVARVPPAVNQVECRPMVLSYFYRHCYKSSSLWFLIW
jgi:alcohol dehydrogenase (NADP+)